jgi:hypothetical protein
MGHSPEGGIVMNETRLLFVLAAIFAASFAILWAVEAAGFYRKYRGKRLITCPETRKTEAVEIATGKGALKAVLGRELRLKDCTRWPERADCGQDCLSQIEAAPHDCLVTNIIANWYQGKVCAFCGKPFTHLEWHEHRPALLDPEGNTVQWHEVPAQLLPEIMLTHKPVCWQCHVHESFRHQHPELVTDRAEKSV